MSRNILILRQIYDKISVYPEMSNKQILDQGGFILRKIFVVARGSSIKSNVYNSQIAWLDKGGKQIC